MASNQKSDDFMSDINVTPLVDVMLVLLIVLMVTASYTVTKGLEVNLPKASTGDDQKQTLTLVIAKEGQWSVDEHPLDAQQLIQQVRRLQAKSPRLSAIIAADEETAHRHLVRALDVLRQVNVTEVSIGVKPGGSG